MTHTTSSRATLALLATLGLAATMGIAACSQTITQSPSDVANSAKATAQSIASDAAEQGKAAASSAASYASAGASEAADQAKNLAKGTTGKTLTVSDSNTVVTVPDDVENVHIQSSNVKLTSTHALTSLTIDGSNNSVNLESAKKITFTGSQNVVHYTSGDPDISDSGTGNSVSED